eukprot:2191253-Pyramimonas_sp.AAC.1
MRQTDASDACELTPLITSPAAPLQPDGSNNRNSFADLVRAADRVQRSVFDRPTRLMSSNRSQ